MWTALLVSCDNNDDNIEFQDETKKYKNKPIANSTVKGTATFIENKDGSTTIEIELSGAKNTETYSPRILVGNAVDTGTLSLSLKDVEGKIGKSSTTVSKLNNNSAVKFKDFKEMKEHTAIYLKGKDSETKIAVADIVKTNSVRNPKHTKW